jgi:hypothetical protein
VRIWYQSYVDYEHGKVHWDRLREHLKSIVDPGTEVDIKGITPQDSYAHSLVEMRCAREVICNAVRKPLVAAGCDVLVPGGGIPMLLFAAMRDHVVDGAPVINGIPIVVKMAELAVKLRRLTGLGVRRVSDYPQPPAEVIAEFMAHPKGL